ncbi:hypothetical protein ACFSUD_08290 [Sulfitobacter aestuarii]|uniref:Uncharacterized protein n=1 Tax=Sulfitobacter aestuarii TaxID=2161676 RepID=A0ABW5U104_9RHOB
MRADPENQHPDKRRRSDDKLYGGERYIEGEAIWKRVWNNGYQLSDIGHSVLVRQRSDRNSLNCDKVFQGSYVGNFIITRRQVSFPSLSLENITNGSNCRWFNLNKCP